ncbi:hypothetical protein [Myceligenerans cantabricum]
MANTLMPGRLKRAFAVPNALYRNRLLMPVAQLLLGKLAGFEYRTLTTTEAGSSTSCRWSRSVRSDTRRRA